MMPLFIVLVAGALWMFSAQRNAQSNAQVKQHVQTLCEDAAGGREIASRLNNPSALVSEQIAAAIKDACDSPKALAALRVVVIAGDNKSYGDGTATHTAILRVGEKDVLGLRIRYQGQGKPIEMLGFWPP